MGDAPCDLLETELALDRVEAKLAAELPAHMRAFAQAYAAGTPPPAAPDIAGRAASATVGGRALLHPTIADRGLALLRLVAPIVIERDAGVTAARSRFTSSTPSWAAYAALSALRDTVAKARFGRSAREVLMLLHGAAEPDAGSTDMPASLDGWKEPDGIELDVDAAWRALVDRYRIKGALAVVRADVRPRAFVVEPGREVIAVVPPRANTPAGRFAVLHELGHAVANLLVAGGLPRVLDEAVASLVARDLEATTPSAVRARTRRTQIARALAAVERGSLPGDALAPSPPWALWHDPAAQAAYVAAESLAHQLAGAADLGAALAAERTRIDATTVL
ncbi:MAG: hypothetical protein H0T46_21815 [Deltaproteobacteria bacterium]|nr:hypothetical protein [Deltaproteobacteria bacterium]